MKNKEKKITIKYFLNRRLRERKVKGTSYFPMYIFLIYDRKNTLFRSVKYPNWYNEVDFLNIEKDEEELKAIREIVEDEIKAQRKLQFKRVIISYQNRFLKYIK